MQRATTQILYYEHSAQNPVTMRVKPGEVFEVETQMNRGPDLDQVPDSLRGLFGRFRSDEQPKDKGNPASGNIYVEGSRPGHVVVVHVEAIETHSVGFTEYPGSTDAMPGYLGPSNLGPLFRVCRIENKRIEWSSNVSFPVEPMLGVVGVAPDREVRHNGWAGEWGGNMDVQEVTIGASVMLRVFHPGALLHIGDMHARQGDGEICGGGGIETGGIVRLRVELRDRPAEMTWPRVENASHIMTVAQGKPAEDAFRLAMCEMILWLESDFNMPRGEAFMFLAQCAEARVTQFVNPSYTYVCKVNKAYLKR